MNERVWRCAAQHAYFALRDYKIKLRLLRHFIDNLQSLTDSTLIFDSKFPQNKIYSEIYSIRPHIGMKLTKGQVSRVYLGNVLRWMRNLMKRGFRTKYGQVVASNFNSQPTPPHLAYELARWLARDMPKFLRVYMRSLSRQLTRQVKRVLNSSERPLPSTKIGGLIGRILKKNHLDIKKLKIEDWNRVRRYWSQETKKILEGDFKNINLAPLATHAVQEGQAGLTQEKVINLLFNFHTDFRLEQVTSWRSKHTL